MKLVFIAILACSAWKAAATSLGPLEQLQQKTEPIYKDFLGLLHKQVIFYASKVGNGSVKPEAFGLTRSKLDKILKDSEKITAAPAFNSLAQSYMFLNKADVAKIELLSELCADNGLLDPSSKLCQDTPIVLFKMVESRINLITYYALTSSTLLQLPEGWILHVEHAKDGLVQAGLGSLLDSFGFALTLLRHHAKLPDVIESFEVHKSPSAPAEPPSSTLEPKGVVHADDKVSSNKLPSYNYDAVSKNSMTNSESSNPEAIPVVHAQPIPSAPPLSMPRTKITIDARNIKRCNDPMDGFISQALGSVMTI